MENEKNFKLPKSVQDFVDEKAKICQPDSIYVCNGSEEEYQRLLKILQDSGMIQKLEHMKNWYFKFSNNYLTPKPKFYPKVQHDFGVNK